MAKEKPQHMDAIAVRRAVVADADKVRYRVYTSPREFVAVIAESALMAMRVANVTEPFKIVRDLPIDGVSIEASKLAAREAELTIDLPTRFHEKPKPFVPEPSAPQPLDANFISMQLGDLPVAYKPEVIVLPPSIFADMPMQPAASPAKPATNGGSAAAEPPPEEGPLSPEEVEKLLSQ